MSVLRQTTTLLNVGVISVEPERRVNDLCMTLTKKWKDRSRLGAIYSDVKKKFTLRVTRNKCD